MKKISEHLGEIIVALACLAFFISVTTMYRVPIKDFFTGLTNGLGNVPNTVLVAFDPADNSPDDSTGDDIIGSGGDIIGEEGSGGGNNASGGNGGESGGEVVDAPEITDFYTYTLLSNGTGYKVSLKPDFKTAVNKNKNYVVDGETLWPAGSALPNPGSTYSGQPVKSMAGMFEDYKDLTSLDLSSFDTSNVVNMSSMFHGCNSLTSLDLSSFDTSNVVYMDSMFYDCWNVTSLDLSSFDTSNVTDMTSMFNYCYELMSLDLSSFDTSNVTDMDNMFFFCYDLTSLDLSSFDTSNVTTVFQMFYDCQNLTTIYASADFDVPSGAQDALMFFHCYELEGGNGTDYDETYTDKRYAQIDANNQPGYFTERAA